MSQEATAAAATESQPATASQLKSACSGADPAFLFSELERGATLDQARGAWITEQQKRLEVAEKALDDLKARTSSLKSQASTLGVKALGTANLGAGTAVEGDPIVAWNEAVQAKITAGFTKPRAIAAVVHESPELHRAYIAAHNAAHRKA